MLPLVQRPIALGSLLVAVAMSVWPTYRAYRRRQGAAAAGTVAV